MRHSDQFFIYLFCPFDDNKKKIDTNKRRMCEKKQIIMS